MNFGNFSTSSFQNCLATTNKTTNFRSGFSSVPSKNDNCDNHGFLMISKTRVPDIQMINKYYGLVPKKFAINSRNTDQSSKFSTKLRAKSAFTLDSSSNHNNSRKGSGSTRALRSDSNSFNVCRNPGNNISGDEEFNDLHSSSRQLQFNKMGETKNGRISEVVHSRRSSHAGQVEIIARKMPVEKYKRWKRGKSLALMDNNANINNHLVEKDNRNFQRVIKIDLNNMKWEESYQTKTTSVSAVNENMKECLDSSEVEEHTFAGADHDKPNHSSSYNSQVQNQNVSTSTKIIATTSSLITNNDTNNVNSSMVKANGSVTKRGSLRKTISFDEQLLQSAPVENPGAKTDSDNVKNRRPMTATNRPSQNFNTINSCKVSPWMTRPGQTTTERRAKLQKSNSTQSVDHDQYSSVDFLGQGESDNEQDPSMDFPSWAYRESRRTLHVQALPEVSTMVSAISPPADEEIQSEIDKVAIMLNNLQSQQNCIVEPEATVKVDLVSDTDKSITNTAETTTTETQTNNDDRNCKENDQKLEIDQNAIETGKTVNSFVSVRDTCSGATEGVETDKKVVARRPLLKKSVSISCEKELYSTSGGSGKQSENGSNNVANSNAKSCRPKTAAPSRNLTKSSTNGTRPTLASLKSNDQDKPNNNLDQSQGLKNRKILIKKALIEINQASTGFGKRVGSMGRPKTAPVPDKNTPNTSIPNNQRQPFKAARSPAPPSIAAARKLVVPLKKMNTIAPKMDPARTAPPAKTQEMEPQEEANTEEKSENTASETIKHRGLKRQSFSLDDGLLLGLSTKEFNRNVSEDIKDAEISFLSSKKREECLKIYEKMMKTGCAIKLDTIFRGMMTPSEYRTFIKVAEDAAREAAEQAEEAAEGEKSVQNTTLDNSLENDGNAGVSNVSLLVE